MTTWARDHDDSTAVGFGTVQWQPVRFVRLSTVQSKQPGCHMTFIGTGTIPTSAPTSAPTRPPWETKERKYCSGRWGQDWGHRSEKSLDECKASCVASSSCSTITTGTYGGKFYCVLCTSTTTRGAHWTTTHVFTERSVAPVTRRRRRRNSSLRLGETAETAVEAGLSQSALACWVLH